jgi:hypothetical protein
MHREDVEALLFFVDLPSVGWYWLQPMQRRASASIIMRWQQLSFASC